MTNDERDEHDKDDGALLEYGWFTSWNRDDWATARNKLLSVGGEPMDTALMTVASGMVVLCLDETASWSRRESAVQFWHGGAKDGGNRWFDKTLQLVVTANGKMGFVGEHSMADGMPTVGYLKYLAQNGYTKLKDMEQGIQEQQQSDREENEGNGQQEGQPCDIFQDVERGLTDKEMSQLRNLVSRGRNDFLSLQDQYEMDLLTFHGYGSTQMKEFGFAPDAFAQVALQLATYRLFGKQAGTYESSQVRPFLHGRTETTRSVSMESKAFVEAMGPVPQLLRSGAVVPQEQDYQTRRELLEAATKAHTAFSRLAGQAQGVDRHFFGLSMLVQDGEDVPDLLQHPLFVRSKRWRVSTSTVPGCEPGFGPVVTDGVGIGYDVKDTYCVFTITSRKEHNWTAKLRHFIEEALLEMREIGRRKEEKDKNENEKGRINSRL